jgi:hypothetical protein
MVNTRQFAWVVAALLGWYGGAPLSTVRYILELNGPGTAVFNELRSLKYQIVKYQIDNGYPALSEQGLKNIFSNIRTYIYSRPDSMGAGFNWHFKTTGPLKVTVMERLRDFVTNGQMRIRSADLITEMSTVAREGDVIKAPNTMKDDRVLALALAIHCWEGADRKQLITQRRTREAEAARRNISRVDQVRLYSQNIMESFFKQKSMQRQLERQFALRQAWRNRR